MSGAQPIEWTANSSHDGDGSDETTRTRPQGPRRLTFCRHPQCGRGARELWFAAGQVAQRRGLDLDLAPALTVCRGECRLGPYVGVPDWGFFYHRLEPRMIAEVFSLTCIEGRPIFPYLLLGPTRVYDSRVIFDRGQEILLAMENRYCLVALVTYLYRFNAAESCGKCFPCRFGVHWVGRLLTALMEGLASADDVAELGRTVRTMTEVSYCQFAAKVTAPVRLALELRPRAFLDHAGRPCVLDTGAAPGTTLGLDCGARP